MGLVVIGVAPEARNQGVGQVLLAEFERRARQHGAEQAHLSVKKNNPQAHRAYEKAGWVRLREDGVNYVFTKVLS
jgi:ribosomal protein S18 acetylase RimI-like enzyme